jgi:hypothetical protein
MSSINAWRDQIGDVEANHIQAWTKAPNQAPALAFSLEVLCAEVVRSQVIGESANCSSAEAANSTRAMMKPSWRGESDLSSWPALKGFAGGGGSCLALTELSTSKTGREMACAS